MSLFDFILFFNALYAAWVIIWIIDDLLYTKKFTQYVSATMAGVFSYTCLYALHLYTKSASFVFTLNLFFLWLYALKMNDYASIKLTVIRLSLTAFLAMEIVLTLMTLGAK